MTWENALLSLAILFSALSDARLPRRAANLPLCKNGLYTLSPIISGGAGVAKPGQQRRT